MNLDDVLAEVETVDVQDAYPFYEKDGVLYYMPSTWNRVDWYTALACEHETTMCPECLDQWGSDHEVYFTFKNGSRMTLAQILGIVQP